MQKNTRKHTAPIDITSIETLCARKEQLQGELDVVEERMAGIWHDMFRQPTAAELNSPTKRFMAAIMSASGVIDGALLGWKLYRRFGGVKTWFWKKKR